MKQRTYYSQQPAEFERGKFQAAIRLDIKKEAAVTGEVGNDEAVDSQFSALEFTQYEPITQNLFIELIFTELYGNDYEAKLINEYNAAKLSLYPDGVAEQKIVRYRTFLEERAAYKAEIERICNDNNIK